MISIVITALLSVFMLMCLDKWGVSEYYAINHKSWMPKPCRLCSSFWCCVLASVYGCLLLDHNYVSLLLLPCSTVLTIAIDGLLQRYL